MSKWKSSLRKILGSKLKEIEISEAVYAETKTLELRFEKDLVIEIEGKNLSIVFYQKGKRIGDDYGMEIPFLTSIVFKER